MHDQQNIKKIYSLCLCIKWQTINQELMGVG